MTIDSDSPSLIRVDGMDVGAQASILFSQLLCNLVPLRVALAAGYLDPGTSDSIESFLKGMALGQEVLLFD